MSIRRLAYLPIVTYPDPMPDELLEGAIATASTLGYDLHATAFSVEIPRVYTPIGGLLIDVPEMIRAAEQKSRNECERISSLFGAKNTSDRPAADCEVQNAKLGRIEELAAAQARYFDLSLLPWVKDRPELRQLAESLVFGSGRPALLLPQDKRLDRLSHVALAWDGSRTAARAVADAMQFVRDGTRLTIITVRDEKPLGTDLGGSLAASMERRGLACRAETIDSGERPIACVLQDHALECGADLLVMGGYGHSRVRDFVLGGATRGVLSDMRLPVLLSH